MRLSLTVAAFLIAEQCNSFSLFTSDPIKRHHTSLTAEASPAAPEKKSLSSADILARSRKAAGVPDVEEEEEGTKLFDDSLIEDMQQSLMTLEKRVKEGPGSISLLEVQEFHAMTGRIVKDMKEKEAARLNSLSSGSFPVDAPKAAASTITEAAPAVSTAETAPQTSAPVEIVKSKDEDNSENEEGPGYDGTGGMGLAKGTANTWIIPGMEEMSPQEYQDALQKSVSDRQTQRQQSGIYGNRATNDYLNNLNGKTSGGMIK
jgi:hypothetical protein